MKLLRQILIITAVIIAAGGAFFGGMTLAKSLQARYAESDEAASADETASETDAISPLNDDSVLDYSIVYNGQTYHYNANLRNVLLIGVDCMDPVADMTADSEALCDFLLLISLDQSTGECTLIQLNRDTMTDVPWVYDDGTYGGYNYESLAFAHDYGGTQVMKCENTVNAVSGLLYYIPIDNYISINMGGIPGLVDLVDGVTIPILYDFSQSDTVLSQYEIGEQAHLDGETALVYVRARFNIQDTTNADRMVRQQVFMHALAAELRDRYNEDSQFALDAFMTAGDYLVTDCLVDELLDFAGVMASVDTSEIIIPKGHNTTGERYTEFYPDEDALQELVVETFFLPVE